MRTKVSLQMAEPQVSTPVDQDLVTGNLLPAWMPPEAGPLFSLSDEVFYPDLSYGVITF